MSSTIINVSQVLGRDLFALKTVSVYTNSGSLAYTVNAGERVGTVFSWLERSGQIIWILEDGNQVYHSPGTFNFQAIIDQGGKTTEQLLKEQEDAQKTWFERTFSNIGESFQTQSNVFKTGLTILIVLVLVVVAIKVIQMSKINFKNINPQTT